MTREEAKSCIGTIEMLQRLAYNIHGVMDVIDADNCKKIIKALEQEPKTGHWIEDDMTYCGVDLTNYKCDKCGEIGGTWRKGLKPDKLPKYCMNCGCKMVQATGKE